MRIRCGVGRDRDATISSPNRLGGKGDLDGAACTRRQAAAAVVALSKVPGRRNARDRHSGITRVAQGDGLGRASGLNYLAGELEAG